MYLFLFYWRMCTMELCREGCIPTSEQSHIITLTTCWLYANHMQWSPYLSCYKILTKIYMLRTPPPPFSLGHIRSPKTIIESMYLSISHGPQSHQNHSIPRFFLRDLDRKWNKSQHKAISFTENMLHRITSIHNFIKLKTHLFIYLLFSAIWGTQCTHIHTPLV